MRHCIASLPAELSELVARLPPSEQPQSIAAVGADRAAAGMSIVRPRLGGRLVGALPREMASRTLATMPVDDAVAALRHVEPGARAALLATLAPAQRAELERLLKHPADTAGGLMTTDMRTARIGEPIDDIVTRIQRDPTRARGLVHGGGARR